MIKKKLIILIVDDNVNFIDRMISLLDASENIGYINVANNYDEASRSLITEKPDIVLLDINLPGKNGIELLRKIKESNWACQVVMITNHIDEYYREQCTELGATHFLDKSNDFGLVPVIINEWNQN